MRPALLVIDLQRWFVEVGPEDLLRHRAACERNDHGDNTPPQVNF